MTLQELYNYIYGDGKIPEPDAYIEICENNLSTLDVSDTERLPIEDYHRLCKIRSEYALCLGMKDQYSPAIFAQDIAIQLWENHEEPQLPLIQVQYYELLRFHRALAYYYTKKHDECYQEFIWLVTNYPKNEKYKNWLLSLRKEKLTRHQNKAAWTIFITVLIHLIILPRNDYNDYLVNTIYVIAIITMLVLEIMKQRIKE